MSVCPYLVKEVGSEVVDQSARQCDSGHVEQDYSDGLPFKLRDIASLPFRDFSGTQCHSLILSGRLV
jgi:hypothetical protein